jgi:AcrR family transcriptional regulator
MDKAVHNIYIAFMARPKEFDREVVLETAKEIFWRKGYKGTSTEDLRLAMGIGRQSFYDSFGGKRQIFIEVLRRYNADGIQSAIARLSEAPSPVAGLSDLLLSFSKEKPRRRALGCMGVAAMCDLGISDPEIARIGKSSSARLESILEQILRDAKTKGSARKSLNVRAAARQLNATIMGLKVMSKAGASTERLRDVAVSALEGIT